jgi:hypothetical protein
MWFALTFSMLVCSLRFRFTSCYKAVQSLILNNSKRTDEKRPFYSIVPVVQTKECDFKDVYSRVTLEIVEIVIKSSLTNADLFIYNAFETILNFSNIDNKMRNVY